MRVSRCFSRVYSSFFISLHSTLPLLRHGVRQFHVSPSPVHLLSPSSSFFSPSPVPPRVVRVRDPKWKGKVSSQAAVPSRIPLESNIWLLFRDRIHVVFLDYSCYGPMSYDLREPVISAPLLSPPTLLLVPHFHVHVQLVELKRRGGWTRGK